METNYSKHAAVWDWDDYDRTEEFEFWHKMSQRYGNKVFSPMCALGQIGAYMAEKGSCVTVLDYTKEMIDEGKKRFDKIKNLAFVVGDICQFDIKEIFDFCFITDMNLLTDIESVKRAFTQMNRHLRMDGGLGLQVIYPYGKSHTYPMTRFDPRVPKNNGVTIWKEGDSRYDAASKRQNIHQIIYIKTKNNIKSFDHYVTLQLYDKDVLFNILKQCGFQVLDEYCDYNYNKSDEENANSFIELKKVKDI